jgi:hypothetical protein
VRRSLQHGLERQAHVEEKMVEAEERVRAVAAAEAAVRATLTAERDAAVARLEAAVARQHSLTQLANAECIDVRQQRNRMEAGAGAFESRAERAESSERQLVRCLDEFEGL